MRCPQGVLCHCQTHRRTVIVASASSDSNAGSASERAGEEEGVKLINLKRRQLVVIAPLCAAAGALAPSVAKAEGIEGIDMSEKCRECLGTGSTPCEFLYHRPLSGRSNVAQRLNGTLRRFD